MAGRDRGLAELHLHLYGTIRARDFLDYIVERVDDVAWSFYDKHLVAAYGEQLPVREVVERHRDGDPDAAAEFERLFVFGDDDAGNFDRFQAKFNLLNAGSEMMPLMRGAPGAFDRLRVEIVHFLDAIRADQLGQGIGYAEQRLLVGHVISAENARILLAEVAATYASYDGITQRLAVGLPREDPWPVWEIATELALGPHGDSVTGVDFCFVEEGHPPKDKADFFRAVHEFNDTHPERALAILYHVGESFRDKSLESAVRWVHESAEMGAHRLGHAIALGVEPACYGEHDRGETVAERIDQIDYDLAHAKGLRAHGVTVDQPALERERAELAEQHEPDDVLTHRYDANRLRDVRRRQDYAMDAVAASGAVVEVCPTSNVRIGNIADPAHHPVVRFLERGVPVAVGSDDPGIFGTTVAQELDWVARVAGLDPTARDELAARAWDYRSEVLTGRIAAHD